LDRDEELGDAGLTVAPALIQQNLQQIVATLAATRDMARFDPTRT
jgi:hypothetical protein